MSEELGKQMCHCGHNLEAHPWGECEKCLCLLFQMPVYSTNKPPEITPDPPKEKTTDNETIPE